MATSYKFMDERNCALSLSTLGVNTLDIQADLLNYSYNEESFVERKLEG